MGSRQLSNTLKARAFEIGFHAVGICPATPVERAKNALVERIGAGLLKGYGFSPETAARYANPQEALPGAKSVVVVALSYLTRGDSGFAPIARFARGEDYHKVVSDKLRELADWLVERVPEARTLLCVDTGPVLDRPLAHKAGVGSYGKNTLIQVPGRGSWVVLGEILTDVDLAPDKPADFDNCKNCDLCLKSCPTGAIIAPYIIDANRCISHLTQMKGYIPRELRPFVVHTIYGCDICQEVCPQNRDVEETDAPEFLSLCGLRELPDLVELLKISAREFNRTIKPTAIGWIGRTRLRRNVALVLGNLQNPEVVTVLTKTVADPNAMLRAHAAWALGRIGGADAKKALIDALNHEREQEVTEEISAALSDSEPAD